MPLRPEKDVAIYDHRGTSVFEQIDSTDRDCRSWDYFSAYVPLYIFGPETCHICGGGLDQELAYSIIDTLMVGGPVCCLTFHHASTFNYNSE